MNKLLPILLVVVLSGCAYDQYAGGVKKPFIPDSMKGGSAISFDAYKENYSKLPKQKIKTNFVWNQYSKCMRDIADSEDSSILDYFKDSSFNKVIACGKKKASCIAGCTNYENRFIDFADFLLVEVEQGNLTSSTAKIELIKYQDDMLEKYKTMVFREQEKLARLEAEERARQRRIWNLTMDSIQDSLNSMQRTNDELMRGLKEAERDRTLKRIEGKIDGRNYY